MLKRKSIRSEHVTLVGHGLTGQSRQAVLVFETGSGDRLRLVLELDQLPLLARGIVHVEAEARREGTIEGSLPATPVDRWTTTKEEGRAILSLSVLGGLELRFAITPESTGQGSQSAAEQA
jgi:hypothetical protein